MCDFVFSLQEFLKIAPGLVIFPFSIYLAWKKISHKISCSFTVGSNRINAKRITSVALTNHKDKPITIFEIFAICENEIAFTIEKLDPPIILKALESCVIETKPYSTLFIGMDRYEPDLMFGKIQIYVTTSNKSIQCRMISHPTMLNDRNFEYLVCATKINKTFNSISYNENAKFAVIYKLNSVTKTAIIDQSGFINGDNDFRYNMIPTENLTSTESVRKFFETYNTYLLILGVEMLD